MISAQEALKILYEGNHRFVSGVSNLKVLTNQDRRHELETIQEPFAIILGCSDSRVPVEIVFDQGFGDLFVIRIAGNIVAPSQIGSVEFAAEKFGTRLVVVMGHSKCGAILATLEEIRHESKEKSQNLYSIIDHIRPSIDGLPGAELENHSDSFVQQAVRANICASVNLLQQGSEVLERLIKKDGLVIVGAEYSLETGIVDFFDNVP
ncbi:MAG: carbonic anhydrase [Gammaproteobacteria bacterium]|nr:carbonic anhydrase [Gammaproteobacteria bacterium]